MKLTYHDDCWEAASVPVVDEALQAGIRWLKVHGDPVRAYAVAEKYPTTDVIYRPVDPPGLAALGDWMGHVEFRDIRACAEAQTRVGDIRPRGNLWVEGINEPVLHNETEAVWFGKVEALRSVLMAERGLKVVVGNFATGNPEPALFRLWLQTYIAHGGRRDALLGIHEYGWRGLAPAADEYNMLGHRRLIRESGGIAAGFRWAVTECGMDLIKVGDQWVGGSWTDQRMTEAEYWAYLLAYSAELDRDPAVVCACVYTWGAPARWKGYELENAREFNRLMLDAIKSHSDDPESYQTTDALRLRSGPSTAHKILLVMPKGSAVDVHEKGGLWWRVQYGDTWGWCSSQYLKPWTAPAEPPRQPTPAEAMAQLAPQYELDPAIAMAVMRVEAGGAAFGKDGRMIIRFEPHVFLGQLRDVPRFDLHFDIGVGGVAAWQGGGHRFRVGPDAPWQAFHGVQAKEWEALTVARSLNDEAALRSISMGAGQVMGFNHRAVGYTSARAMFDALGVSSLAQVRAMLDYCKSRGILGALRTGDFLTFARAYNGAGQAEHYARLIEQAAKLNGWVRV